MAAPAHSQDDNNPDGISTPSAVQTHESDLQIPLATEPKESEGKSRKADIRNSSLVLSRSSRGIGFALARRVLQTTNAPVVTTARKDLDKTKEELLDGLDVDEKRLTVLKLDVLGTYLAYVIMCTMAFEY